jgi:hypothetical protein
MKLAMAIPAFFTAVTLLATESGGNAAYHVPEPDYSSCHQSMWTGNNNNTMEQAYRSPSPRNNNGL